MTSSIKAYNAFKKVPGMSDTDAQEVASLFELIPKDIATKQDIAEVRTEIAELRAELKQDIAELRTEVRTEIAEVRTEIAAVRADIADAVTKAIKWMVGLAVTCVTLAIAISGVLATLAH